MFERPHHQRVARVLQALDGERLRDHACYFGGGTAIALRYGEYRESVDIDFLVSDVAHYRALRTALTGVDGLRAITRSGMPVPGLLGELRADRYGIRARVELDGHPIKTEIVLEARIELEAPGPADAICGISTLTPLDLAASKLLANSDGWADDGVFGRDLIDLAMMRPPLVLLRKAVAKAEDAYGASVLRDLDRAIERMKTRQGWLDRCVQAMDMRDPKAVVWQRIRGVGRVLPKG